ncbi:MAG: hypothetical protein WAM70_16065, partial [Pyrinomonadaceae bacterium]
VQVREYRLESYMIANVRDLTTDKQCLINTRDKKGEVVYDFMAPTADFYVLSFGTKSESGSLVALELNGQAAGTIEPERFGLTRAIEVWLTEGKNHIRLSLHGEVTICEPTLVRELPATLSSLEGSYYRRVGVIELAAGEAIVVVPFPAELNAREDYILEVQGRKLRARRLSRFVNNPALGDCYFAIRGIGAR